MPTWSPDQYLKFEDARFRPAMDLLQTIRMDNPKTVYDLGCGTGHITKTLQDRWPQARVIGMDASSEMLTKAKSSYPDMQWELGDLNSWEPDTKMDLLFSNAALHWIDNHHQFFPILFNWVNEGATMAIQMPNNFANPTHTTIGTLVKSEQWSDKLLHLLREKPVLSPPQYVELLQNFTTKLDIWETIYYQILTGDDPVTEWTKGSVLRPFLQALENDEKEVFLSQYSIIIQKAYPKNSQGQTLLPFKRLFIHLQT